MLWVTLCFVALLSLPLVSRPVWRGVLPWFKVLWACRVSVVSVVFGLLLLGLVPQARDLFAESNAPTAWWVWFFLAVFFGWAFAVHYSARQVLTFDDWAVSRDMPEPQKSLRRAQVRLNYRWPIAYVPRILGLLCFVALAIGISRQRANFADAADRIDLVRSVGDHLDRLFDVTVWCALVFAIFVVLRGAVVEGKFGLSWADIKNSLLAAPREIERSDPLWFRYWFSPSAVRRRWTTSRHTVVEEGSTVFYFLFLVGLLIAALVNPLWLSGTVSRSMVLVVMLGAWVVPLSYVTIWSNYLRAPLLLLLAALLGLTSLTSIGFHDLRLADTSSGHLRPADRQVTMNEAIAQWRKANCTGEQLTVCPAPIIVAGQGGASRAAYFLGSVVGHAIDRTRAEADTYADAAKRIFALSTVSGGSLGAIVIRAALEDDLRAGRPGGGKTSPCKQTDGLWFNHDPDVQSWKWEDCMQAILAGDFLSPTFIGVAFRDLFSIDDPFTGLPLWGDRAALLERSWEARYRSTVATSAAAGRDKEPGLARPLGYLKQTVWPQDGGNGWLPLLFLNATSVNTGHRIVASDVKPYLCDGTNRPNVLYSQAYDIFELFSWTKKDRPPQAVTGFCGAGPVENEWSARAPDLRLSTAGAMSARFPIVSPAGRIVGGRDGEPVVLDRVIDGGYFENDGLATALDIAKALRDNGLRPVVVRVTNDPVPHPVEDADPVPTRTADATGAVEATNVRTRPSRPMLPRDGFNVPFPTPADAGIFEAIYSPLIGLYNTRQGHGSEAADAVSRQVAAPELSERVLAAGLESSAYIEIQIRDALGADACEKKKLKVKPGKLPEVSMSWWLSQPVQAYLDAQVCDRANQHAFDVLLRHLKADARADLSSDASKVR